MATERFLGCLALFIGSVTRDFNIVHSYSSPNQAVGFIIDQRSETADAAYYPLDRSGLCGFWERNS